MSFWHYNYLYDFQRSIRGKLKIYNFKILDLLSILFTKLSYNKMNNSKKSLSPERKFVGRKDK